MSDRFCPTCQREGQMKYGASQRTPPEFAGDMMGQMTYECRTCKQWGCGPGSSPGLICSFASSPFKTFIDGNMWCAVRHDFVNLQESLAGFGPTLYEAIVDYFKNEKSEMGLKGDQQ